MASSHNETMSSTPSSVIALTRSTRRESVVPRDHRTRPVYKLSARLVETYRGINQVYYEAKALAQRSSQQDDNRGGVHNDGYDDSSYDYIVRENETLADRYIVKHRIGKGSFGQVYCAYDRLANSEVAIKIIKSRKPFMVQAQMEIEILNLLFVKDPDDEQNIVRLLDTFIYRNHQFLVFEMLSHNLYDLLKSTRFKGISLNLIRKFSRQILKALDFLAQSKVDIIHCDLKPENILLKHPRRSTIKIIDFGSSCFSNGRTYTYIQSRFYRSPEVLLGIAYDHKIDMWSLACVLVEMHTGEPLFGGQDQMDQVCRIVDVLGMPPVSLLERSPPPIRQKFFNRIVLNGDTADPSSTSTSSTSLLGEDVVRSDDGSLAYVLIRPAVRPRDAPPKRTLEDIIGVHTGGPMGRRAGEAGHSLERYEEYLDFIRRMLAYEPLQRLSAFEASLHPFLISGGSDLAIQAAVVSSVANTTSQVTHLSIGEGDGGEQQSVGAAVDEEGQKSTQKTKERTGRKKNANGSRSAPSTQPEIPIENYFMSSPRKQQQPVKTEQHKDDESNKKTNNDNVESNESSHTYTSTSPSTKTETSTITIAEVINQLQMSSDINKEEAQNQHQKQEEEQQEEQQQQIIIYEEETSVHDLSGDSLVLGIIDATTVLSPLDSTHSPT
eukprot:gene3327-6582_t